MHVPSLNVDGIDINAWFSIAPNIIQYCSKFFEHSNFFKTVFQQWGMICDGKCLEKTFWSWEWQQFLRRHQLSQHIPYRWKIVSKILSCSKTFEQYCICKWSRKFVDHFCCCVLPFERRKQISALFISVKNHALWFKLQLRLIQSVFSIKRKKNRVCFVKLRHSVRIVNLWILTQATSTIDCNTLVDNPRLKF